MLGAFLTQATIPTEVQEVMSQGSGISSSPNIHVLLQTSIASQPKLEKLPGFQEVPLNQQQQLFIDKLEQCNVIFNYDNFITDLPSKEVRQLALTELQDYVADNGLWITAHMWQTVAKMFAKNIFRPMLRQRRSYHELFCKEDDDEPTLAAWPHIQPVYDLFLITIESKYFTKRLAKSYIDHNFVSCLLERFSSEDPRERDILKAILHSLYRKFHNLRAFIRQSINHIILHFTYESGPSLGVAELLEILGCIISGLASPLKDEYRVTLTRVLLPMHKSEALSKYHLQLVYCIGKLLEKDHSLSQVVRRIQPPFDIRYANKPRLS